MRLSTIILNVGDAADIDRVRRWYEDLLELSVTSEIPDHSVWYQAGTTRLGLHVGIPLENPESVCIGFDVDDVDDVHARLAARGVDFDGVPQDKPWGARAVSARDPVGHTVQFAMPRRDVLDVRRATEDDLTAILGVDARAASGDSDRIAYLTRAVARDDCLVAVDGGAVRGFVVVKRRNFYDRDFIDLLFVAENHRRRGLGRDLMCTAVATATSTEVFTSTNESNAPMRALLKAERWELSGRLVGLDDGDPELVYFLRR